MKIALSGLASSHVDQWIDYLEPNFSATDSRSIATRTLSLFALAQTISEHSDAIYGPQRVRADSFNRVLRSSLPFIEASPQNMPAHLTTARRLPASMQHSLGRRHTAVAVSDRHVGAHYVQAARLLDHGFHVFVDKPFVSSPQHATDLVARARSNGVMVSSASALRFHPLVQWLQSFQLPGGQQPEFTISGGADWKSPFGGPWFYGMHAIELGLALGGSAVNSWRLIHQGPPTSLVISSAGVGGARATYVQVHPDQSQPFMISSEHMPRIVAALAHVPHLAGTYSVRAPALQLQLGPRYMWPLISAWFEAMHNNLPLVPESQLLAAVSIAHAAWGDPPAPVLQFG